MNKLTILFAFVALLIGTFSYAENIADSSVTLGFEALGGCGLGLTTGLTGYFIHKDSDKSSWMPPAFAYAFPAGAAAGVILIGEIKGEPATNLGTAMAFTFVSAYIPLLVGELLGPRDGRGLGTLFSVPAAVAAYNYFKQTREAPDTDVIYPVSFSFEL
ncbi:MAG: hypothetical protein GY771_16335 [bacterium]|nr:hypothetical protein [bacterium]